MTVEMYVIVRMICGQGDGKYAMVDVVNDAIVRMVDDVI